MKDFDIVEQAKKEFKKLDRYTMKMIKATFTQNSSPSQFGP